MQGCFGSQGDEPPPPIVGAVGVGVVEAVVEKAHDRGDEDLAALLLEEGLQVIVAERGVLHVDLPDDPHLDLWRLLDLDGCKLPADRFEVAFHRPADVATVFGKPLAEVCGPLLHQRIGLALVHLIGPYLVGEGHQGIPIEEGAVGLQQHEGGDGEAGALLHPLEVEADDGDMFHVALLECFLQEEVVVARPAATTGLGDDEGHLVLVKAAVLHRIDELADDQLGGVADVVMDIPQPLSDDVGSHVVQDGYLVAVVDEDLLGEVDMWLDHIGDEKGVLLLHFLGKDGTHGISSSVRAASRLRMRIFTAPRFAISSILIWV